METPAAIPVTTPVSEPMEAVPGNEEVQTPPGTPSLSGAVAPAQTLAGPVMDTGERLTVSVAVVLHPVGRI